MPHYKSMKSDANTNNDNNNEHDPNTEPMGEDDFDPELYGFDEDFIHNQHQEWNWIQAGHDGKKTSPIKNWENDKTKHVTDTSNYFSALEKPNEQGWKKPIDNVTINDTREETSEERKARRDEKRKQKAIKKAAKEAKKIKKEKANTAKRGYTRPLTGMEALISNEETNDAGGGERNTETIKYPSKQEERKPTNTLSIINNNYVLNNKDETNVSATKTLPTNNTPTQSTRSHQTTLHDFQSSGGNHKSYTEAVKSMPSTQNNNNNKLTSKHHNLSRQNQEQQQRLNSPQIQKILRYLRYNRVIKTIKQYETDNNKKVQPEEMQHLSDHETTLALQGIIQRRSTHEGLDYNGKLMTITRFMQHKHLFGIANSSKSRSRLHKTSNVNNIPTGNISTLSPRLVANELLPRQLYDDIMLIDDNRTHVEKAITLYLKRAYPYNIAETHKVITQLSTEEIGRAYSSPGSLDAIIKNKCPNTQAESPDYNKVMAQQIKLNKETITYDPAASLEIGTNEYDNTKRHMVASAKGLAKLTREAHPKQHIPIMQVVLTADSLLMHYLIYEPGLFQQMIGITLITLHSKSNDPTKISPDQTDDKPGYQTPTQNRNTPHNEHSARRTNHYNSLPSSIAKPHNPYDKLPTSLPATTPAPSPSGMTIYMHGENEHKTNKYTIQTLTIKQDNLYNDNPMATPTSIMKNVMTELIYVSTQTRHVTYLRPNDDSPHAPELAILPQFPPDDVFEKDYISNPTITHRQTTFNIKIRSSLQYTMIKNTSSNFRALDIKKRHQEFLNQHNLIITPTATPVLQCKYTPVLAIVGTNMNHSIKGLGNDFIKMAKEQLDVTIDPNDITVQIGWTCEPTSLVPIMQPRTGRDERRYMTQDEREKFIVKKKLAGYIMAKESKALKILQYGINLTKSTDIEEYPYANNCDFVAITHNSYNNIEEWGDKVIIPQGTYYTNRLEIIIKGLMNDVDLTNCIPSFEWEPGKPNTETILQIFTKQYSIANYPNGEPIPPIFRHVSNGKTPGTLILETTKEYIKEAQLLLTPLQQNFQSWFSYHPLSHHITAIIPATRDNMFQPDRNNSINRKQPRIHKTERLLDTESAHSRHSRNSRNSGRSSTRSQRSTLSNNSRNTKRRKVTQSQETTTGHQMQEDSKENQIQELQKTIAQIMERQEQLCAELSTYKRRDNESEHKRKQSRSPPLLDLEDDDKEEEEDEEKTQSGKGEDEKDQLKKKDKDKDDDSGSSSSTSTISSSSSESSSSTPKPNNGHDSGEPSQDHYHYADYGEKFEHFIKEKLYPGQTTDTNLRLVWTESYIFGRQPKPDEKEIWLIDENKQLYRVTPTAITMHIKKHHNYYERKGQVTATPLEDLSQYKIVTPKLCEKVIKVQEVEGDEEEGLIDINSDNFTHDTIDEIDQDRQQQAEAEKNTQQTITNTQSRIDDRYEFSLALNNGENININVCDICHLITANIAETAAIHQNQCNGTRNISGTFDQIDDAFNHYMNDPDALEKQLTHKKYLINYDKEPLADQINPEICRVCKLVTVGESNRARIHQECCNGAKETDHSFTSIQEIRQFYKTNKNARSQQFNVKRYLVQHDPESPPNAKEKPHTSITQYHPLSQETQDSGIKGKRLFGDTTYNDPSKDIITDPNIYKMLVPTKFKTGEIVMVQEGDKMIQANILSAHHPMYMIKYHSGNTTISYHVNARNTKLYVPITRYTQIVMQHTRFYHDAIITRHEVGDTVMYNNGDELLLKGRVITADHPNYCIEEVNGERLLTTSTMLRCPTFADMEYILTNHSDLVELDEYQSMVQTAKTAGQFAGAILCQQAIFDRIENAADDIIRNPDKEEENNTITSIEETVAENNRQLNNILSDLNNSIYEDQIKGEITDDQQQTPKEQHTAIPYTTPTPKQMQTRNDSPTPNNWEDRASTTPNRKSEKPENVSAEIWNILGDDDPITPLKGNSPKRNPKETPNTDPQNKIKTTNHNEQKPLTVPKTYKFTDTAPITETGQHKRTNTVTPTTHTQKTDVETSPTDESSEGTLFSRSSEASSQNQAKNETPPQTTPKPNINKREAKSTGAKTRQTSPQKKVSFYHSTNAGDLHKHVMETQVHENSNPTRENHIDLTEETIPINDHSYTHTHTPKSDTEATCHANHDRNQPCNLNHIDTPDHPNILHLIDESTMSDSTGSIPSLGHRLDSSSDESPHNYNTDNDSSSQGATSEYTTDSSIDAGMNADEQWVSLKSQRRKRRNSLKKHRKIPPELEQSQQILNRPRRPRRAGKTL